MKSAIVALKNISIKSDSPLKSFHLGDLSWQIEEGTCWILEGTQESGKKEILQVAAGLRRPFQGTLEIFGKDYWACEDSEMCQIRQKVSYFFEGGTRMFSEFSLRENIALGYCYHKNFYLRETDVIVEKIMEYLGIAEFSECYPLQLVQHQKYKGAFARVLLNKPQVVFVDMSGSDWDSQMQEEFRELLEKVNNGIPEFDLAPVTLIISLQNKDFQIPFATHHALVENGKLIFS